MLIRFNPQKNDKKNEKAYSIRILEGKKTAITEKLPKEKKIKTKSFN